MLITMLLWSAVALAVDIDEDGYDTPEDCDDADTSVFPNAPEVTGDGVDQDCDGHDQCFVDEDLDGYGTDVIVRSAGAECGADDATAVRSGDCNDSSLNGESVRPGAQETCDGLDNNCDTRIDEIASPDAVTWFFDADGDLWGDVRIQIKACGQPIGYVAASGDCDDSEARTYPQNQEVCDGIDNNCVSGADEDSAIDVFTWYRDGDGDGFGDKNMFVQSCEEPTDGAWVRAGTPLDADDSDPTLAYAHCCGPCCATGPSPQGMPWLAVAGVVTVWRRRRSYV